MTQDWQAYFKATEHKPPSLLLTKALTFVHNKDIGLDLGAGSLHDTIYLLKQGFSKIIIVDKELSPNLSKLPSERIEFYQTHFDQYIFPKNTFDLVNAEWALPFNPPNTFSSVIDGLKSSLTTGGVFVGQLFGMHDEWNRPDKNLTFHSIDEVQHMFYQGFEMLECSEIEQDGTTALGKPKHWHYFDVIARKLHNTTRAHTA